MGGGDRARHRPVLAPEQGAIDFSSPTVFSQRRVMQGERALDDAAKLQPFGIGPVTVRLTTKRTTKPATGTTGTPR